MWPKISHLRDIAQAHVGGFPGGGEDGHAGAAARAAHHGRDGRGGVALRERAEQLVGAHRVDGVHAQHSALVVCALQF